MTYYSFGNLVLTKKFDSIYIKSVSSSPLLIREVPTKDKGYIFHLDCLKLKKCKYVLDNWWFGELWVINNAEGNVNGYKLLESDRVLCITIKYTSRLTQ